MTSQVNVFSEYQARSSRLAPAKSPAFRQVSWPKSNLVKAHKVDVTSSLHQQMIFRSNPHTHHDPRPSKTPRFPCAPPRRRVPRDATPTRARRMYSLYSPCVVIPPCNNNQFPRTINRYYGPILYTSLNSSCTRLSLLFQETSRRPSTRGCAQKRWAPCLAPQLPCKTPPLRQASCLP